MNLQTFSQIFVIVGMFALVVIQSITMNNMAEIMVHHDVQIAELIQVIEKGPMFDPENKSCQECEFKAKCIKIKNGHLSKMQTGKVFS